MTAKLSRRDSKGGPRIGNCEGGNLGNRRLGITHQKVQGHYGHKELTTACTRGGSRGEKKAARPSRVPNPGVRGRTQRDRARYVERGPKIKPTTSGDATKIYRPVIAVSTAGKTEHPLERRG